MKTVLIDLTADPRESARATEGCRVAEGLSLSSTLQVTIRVPHAEILQAKPLRDLAQRGIKIETEAPPENPDVVITF